MACKRWLVVTEEFACLRRQRWHTETFASLGAAQDRRDSINRQAEREGWRLRASLVDQRKSPQMPISLLTYTV